MTILGIGTDIVEIQRIEQIVTRSGNRFAQRVLSTTEWIQYQKKNEPIRFLAKRFAVKEAASKAFGTGIRDGISFTQFEVINNTFGKPELKLLATAEKLADKLGVISIHVTLSDERSYAYAIVIIEGKNKNV